MTANSNSTWQEIIGSGLTITDTYNYKWELTISNGYVKAECTDGPSMMAPAYPATGAKVSATDKFGDVEEYWYTTDGYIYNINKTVSTITFTIDGTSYEAEEGMTWAEWTNSSYNTAGYYMNSGTTYIHSSSYSSSYYVVAYSYLGVDKSSTIIEGRSYFVTHLSNLD